MIGNTQNPEIYQLKAAWNLSRNILYKLSSGIKEMSYFINCTA